MNDLSLIDPTISQLNETALANILLYGDSRKGLSQTSKKIYMQQSDLMKHSSKGLKYAQFILYYIFFYISCILATCYMWCVNEIYYSHVKLS